MGIGRPRRSLNRSSEDAERAVISEVRRQCVLRDGYCRVAKDTGTTHCAGPSQWSHFGSRRRAHTVGMAAEDRHSTQWSLMMCQAHHDAYDGRRRPRLSITATTDRVCDGLLEYAA